MIFGGIVMEILNLWLPIFSRLAIMFHAWNLPLNEYDYVRTVIGVDLSSVGNTQHTLKALNHKYTMC